MAASAEAEPRAERAPRRVFISYARKDGSGTAHRLRDTLNAAGCVVWLDTDRIRGGASWSKEIEAALDNCDVLIAVLSEDSYISEVCRAEQMWALEDGSVSSPSWPRPRRRVLSTCSL